MRGLTEKRTLITGGASGIGKATAFRFLEEGAQVLILDQDEKAGRRIKEEMPGLSGFIQADVSDPVQVEIAFDEIDRLLGGLDILINNAGISLRHAFKDITPEEWRRVIDVNLNGLFYVAQAGSCPADGAGGDRQHGFDQWLAGLSLLC
jgi:NAD(P)-dependent dehydrogenase (short-subunit alcohol dehydrogenase family)